jgi:hypothetical protein
MGLPARIVLGCLLAFMLCPANAQEKPPQIVLAIHTTPQGNALYIETKLNGKPATLLLDTGSTVSLCDWKLCGKAPKSTASLELGSWHTDSEDMRPRDLSSISLQAGIRVDGILGLMTMAHFRRVTFDFQQHNLELEP